MKRSVFACLACWMQIRVALEWEWEQKRNERTLAAATCWLKATSGTHRAKVDCLLLLLLLLAQREPSVDLIVCGQLVVLSRHNNNNNKSNNLQQFATTLCARLSSIERKREKKVSQRANKSFSLFCWLPLDRFRRFTWAPSTQLTWRAHFHTHTRATSGGEAAAHTLKQVLH